MTEQKYKKGERVKVFVGHPMWSISGPNKGRVQDLRPELTEDTATVEYTYGQMSESDFKYSKGSDGYKRYSLIFDKHGSICWFDEENIYPVS
jgi:hypothetical protein